MAIMQTLEMEVYCRRQVTMKITSNRKHNESLGNRVGRWTVDASGSG